MHWSMETLTPGFYLTNWKQESCCLGKGHFRSPEVTLKALEAWYLKVGVLGIFSYFCIWMHYISSTFTFYSSHHAVDSWSGNMSSWKPDHFPAFLVSFREGGGEGHFFLFYNLTLITFCFPHVRWSVANGNGGRSTIPSFTLPPWWQKFKGEFKTKTLYLLDICLVQQYCNHKMKCDILWQTIKR